MRIVERDAWCYLECTGSSLASSLAFSTLKRLMTSRCLPPSLPSLLPSLSPATPPYPPLEVELTEDSSSDPVELSSSPEQNEGSDLSDHSNCLSISLASSVDQIPSTVTSLEPR